jgi:hypothetical protein
MRVTAGMIVEAMAAGRTIEQLLADFPYLEVTPERRGSAVLSALQACEAELIQGAIVTLDWTDKPRARVLPLR